MDEFRTAALTIAIIVFLSRAAIGRVIRAGTASLVYTDDMYVDMNLSLQTAKGLGNCRLWLTNEHEHNGLRASDRVLERLLAMEDGLDGFNAFTG